MKFAEILLAQKIGHEKETLTYAIPQTFSLKPGQNVSVNLRNKTMNGIVIYIHEEKPNFKTKEILKINDKKPLLTENQIKLLIWISQKYFCPLYKTLKLFLPTRVLTQKPFRNRQEKTEQFFLTPHKELSEEQKKTIEQITDSKLNKFLIHGITGSGKTEVYSRLAKQHIQENRQVLILVPEIALTPQIIRYFESSLGIKACTIHSRLSEGERYKAWYDIHQEKAKLIIGSRSAIFSPFQKLGLIIIDEEHEFSYKQEQSPRYHALSIAEKIIQIQPEIKLVLGSATPSIETREKLKASTIQMKNRIGKALLPTMEIVDLREEFKKRNYSIFSQHLKEALVKTVNSHNQAILFINRRGSASSIVCRDCGFTVKCENCEIPMTYHKKTLSIEKMICHHCGKISSPPGICPSCQSTHIRFLGIGTERIETDLKKEFPNIRVLRADKDTTSSKDGFKKIYDAFKKHEADVLIGTQMIAKGLHLPKVSLVGVILADIGINIPDFHTLERNFQLLTQVAGRAGRGKTPGKVIIQTYNPNNISLLAAQKHDYEMFLKYERTQRKLLNNPPFSKITKITVEHENQKKSEEKAQEFFEFLKKEIHKKNLSEIVELNVYPAMLPRLRKKYRNIVLIKEIGAENQNLVYTLPQKYNNDPCVKIDVDPVSTV